MNPNDQENNHQSGDNAAAAFDFLRDATAELKTRTYITRDSFVAAAAAARDHRARDATVLKRLTQTATSTAVHRCILHTADCLNTDQSLIFPLKSSRKYPCA